MFLRPCSYPKRARNLAAGIAVAAALASPSRSRSQVNDTEQETPAASAQASLVQLQQAYRAETDDKRRAGLVTKMTWLPGAPDVLRKIIETDTSDDVAFAAANAWRRVVLAGAVNALQARFAGSSDPARRPRLTGEIERYQMFAAGQNVPRFLREAPPVFDVQVENHRHVRVLAFGDFGDGGSRQEEMAEAMRQFHDRKRFDLAITLGDNFYPAGIASPSDDRWRRDFERLYGPLRIPFFACLGNHDWVLADSPTAEILRSARSNSWRMPAMRYAFTAGPVQFFAIDTNLVTRSELDWLDAELGRSKARWKIVYGHHPVYSDGLYRDDPALRDSLMPVLRGRANLYICGHEHDLEHLVQDGSVHFVVAGGGGAALYPIKPSSRSIFAAKQNGFAVIEADSRSVSVSFVDSDLKVLHRFAITTGDADTAKRAAAASP